MPAKPNGVEVRIKRNLKHTTLGYARATQHTPREAASSFPASSFSSSACEISSARWAGLNNLAPGECGVTCCCGWFFLRCNIFFYFTRNFSPTFTQYVCLFNWKLICQTPSGRVECAVHWLRWEGISLFCFACAKVPSLSRSIVAYGNCLLLAHCVGWNVYHLKGGCLFLDPREAVSDVFSTHGWYLNSPRWGSKRTPGMVNRCKRITFKIFFF